MPDREDGVREAGPLGDEGAEGDAPEAQGGKAGVSEAQADGKEDVQGIDQEVADHGPDRILHADEPALEREER